MSGIIAAMPGAISQGVLWGMMVLGVYITYKILDVADLTVDGSFALGGSVCAILTVNGLNPFLAIMIAIIAGVIAGSVTGFLHTVFEIPAILAGILTQIALYSINLRIMGKANIPLLKVETIVTKVGSIFPNFTKTQTSLLIGIVVTVVIIGILYWFFGTETGCALRATGNNEAMVRALGGNTKTMKVYGLMISNGLVALSGALVAQSQGYADVGMGAGAIVIGLASIVIGGVLLGRVKSFAFKLAAVVIGSIVYRVIIAIVLQLGLESSDLKLLTALIVASALAVPVIIEKYRIKIPNEDEDV